jgi:hypothetical protein
MAVPQSLTIPAMPGQVRIARASVAAVTGTGVKAGMLKCAVDAKGATEGVERVLSHDMCCHID